jgi:hypothetical protein
MVAERATRAFWPLWSLLFIALAAVAFGAVPLLGPAGVWTAGAAGLAAIAWAVCAVSVPSGCPAGRRRWTGSTGRCPADRSPRFSIPWPSAMTIPRRSRSGRPMSPAWPNGPHRRAAPEPDLRLSSRDPYALRYVAATALAMALLFGTLIAWRMWGTP